MTNRIPRLVASIGCKYITMVVLFVTFIYMFTYVMAYSEQNAQQYRFSQYYQATLRGQAFGSKDKFKLDVVCSPFKKNINNIDKEKLLDFTDGFVPRCMLSKLSLVINDILIIVPKYAYERIADVVFESIGVESDGANIMVRFNGGDGTWAYEVRFYFSKNKLLSRELEYRNAEGKTVIDKLKLGGLM